MRKVSIAAFSLLIIALFLITSKAKALTSVNISNNGEDSTSTVNVSTNTGGNTICVNGKCTTSDSNSGTSTVCINGKCQTSEDGNLDVKSEDGTAKVEIKNDSSSVNVNQKSDGKVETKVEVKNSALGTSSSTVKQKPAQKEVKEKKFDVKEFFNEKWGFLRKIVTFQFLFGDK